MGLLHSAFFAKEQCKCWDCDTLAHQSRRSTPRTGKRPTPLSRYLDDGHFSTFTAPKYAFSHFIYFYFCSLSLPTGSKSELDNERTGFLGPVAENHQKHHKKLDMSENEGYLPTIGHVDRENYDESFDLWVLCYCTPFSDTPPTQRNYFDSKWGAHQIGFEWDIWEIWPSNSGKNPEIHQWVSLKFRLQSNPLVEGKQFSLSLLGIWEFLVSTCFYQTTHVLD